MIQRHLCKQLRDLISFFTRKWGPRKADRWSWVVSWRQTGGSPLHLRPGARRNETSQGSLIWSRCHATQRPVISRVSSLHEESRWLHQAHCNVSPAERTVRATATEDSSLSPSASGGTLPSGGLNPDSGPGRAPLEAHLLPNSETWEKDPKESDGEGWGQLGFLTSQDRAHPYCGCWNQQRLSGGWRSEPWSQKTRL